MSVLRTKKQRESNHLAPRAGFEQLEHRHMLSADALFSFGSAGEDTPRAGIEVDAVGSSYIAGDFVDSVQLDPAGTPAGLLTSNGQRDIFVAKYDSSGDLIWARSFGGVGDDFAWALEIDAGANVIVTGSFEDSVDFGSGSLSSDGGDDGFVLKLNTLGTSQWARQLAGEGSERVFQLDVDQAGNIYLGGQSRGGSTAVTFGNLPPTAGGAGERFALLAKATPDGTFQWARAFVNGESVNHLAPVVDDRAADPADWVVTAVGEFSGQLTIGSNSLSSMGGTDGFVVLVDADTGQQTLATTSFGGANLDRALGITQDAAGRIYVTGYFLQEADFDPSAVHVGNGDIRQSNGESDGYVLQLNHDLSFSKVFSFGGAGFEIISRNTPVVSAAGDIYLSGSFEAAIDFGETTLVSSGEDDGYILVLDSDLNPRWAERLGGAGDTGSGLLGPQQNNGIRDGLSNDAAGDVAVDGSGNVYVAGTFQRTADFPTGDRLISNGDFDAFLMKLDMASPRISGNTFADFNSNGLRDERLGEGILEQDGWMVELVDGIGSVVASAAPFGNSGNFSFGAVDPGTYTVRQVLPDGWTETTPGSGYNLTVAAGDAPVRVDFGNTTATQSKTYHSTDVNQRIRNNRTITSDLVVPDTLTIFDIDVQLEISHTFDADLDVYLIAPDGTETELLTGVGGGGDNFSGTILDDDAGVGITVGQAPFTGRFRAESNLASLAGKDAQGVWTLRVSDTSQGNTGNLNNWSLTIFGATPAPPVPAITISDVTVTEGASGPVAAQFTVTRTGDASQTVTVDYATADGTATANNDYLASGINTLTFNPGVSSLPVVVTVNGDTNAEPDETFFVNLSNASGATISDAQGLGTIVDDDSSAGLESLYVYDIRFDSKRGGKDYRAIFEIRTDSDGDGQATANDAAASGVSVTVTFAGTTYSGVTDSNGVFRTSWVKDLSSGAYFANAIDLALEGYVWNPFDLDLEDDSDSDGKPDALLSV